jgi:hypothetical protein
MEEWVNSKDQTVIVGILVCVALIGFGWILIILKTYWDKWKNWE